MCVLYYSAVPIQIIVIPFWPILDGSTFTLDSKGPGEGMIYYYSYPASEHCSALQDLSKGNWYGLPS